MTLPDFSFHAPRHQEEAFDLLRQHGDSARLMAGGTDLLPRLRAGRVQCDHVIALKGIEGLTDTRFDATYGLTIGAGSVLADVARIDAVQNHYPMLKHAIDHLATVQVRHKATVAGNLCNASPCADTAPPLMALGAKVVIAGPSGDRELALEHFITGPGQTELQPEELVRSVQLPVPPAGLRTRFIKHSPRSRVDISAVSVAVAVVLEEGLVKRIDIVLGTVAPTPLRAARAEQVLLNNTPTAELIAEAARTAMGECNPITDFRASRSYKIRMVDVLTRQALATVTRMP